MGLKPTVKQRSLNGLKSPGGDQRQTTCSVCGYGIFDGQPRLWSRKPLGLVHTDCAPVGEP